MAGKLKPPSSAPLELSRPNPDFPIDEAIVRLRRAVEPFPTAALFELYDEGYTSAFAILVACIISIRTYDETMLPLARRLLKRAGTPAAMARLEDAEITELIAAATFAESKGPQIGEIARRIVAEHGGELPCDEELLLSFRGVGPKCANLVLGIACGVAKISVDIHVHRVTNRWGYVAARTPEKTMAALERVLPTEYWVEINRLLVPFGKHICRGARPKCPVCPLNDICPKIGVEVSSK